MPRIELGLLYARRVPPHCTVALTQVGIFVIFFFFCQVGPTDPSGAQEWSGSRNYGPKLRGVGVFMDCSLVFKPCLNLLCLVGRLLLLLFFIYFSLEGPN